ncbi:MAG: phosphoenolpyruvate--protein phosphotransferase [Pseudomonadota bacterium]
MTMALHGLGVSRGVSLGVAHIAQRHHLDIAQRTIQEDQIENEVQRFRGAVFGARTELRETRNRIPRSTPAEILEFIDAHVLMLEDGTLTEPPIQLIRELACNAEWALEVQRNRLAAVFDDMDDPYIASRMDDVDQVVARIQRQLATPTASSDGERSDYDGIVLIADDIAPADLTLLHHEGLAGLITEFGGPLSHTAILARSLKIPAAMGVRHARQLFREGEAVIVDGERGIVMADAPKTVQTYYRKRARAFRAQQRDLIKLRSKPAQTRCGTRIRLDANIDLVDDLKDVRQGGADGIGLYRTEYLFLNRADPPSEDEQFETYAEVIAAMGGAPVTIRTIDVGADKPLQGRGPRSGVPINPAMGLRAIRLCLQDLNLFRPQLRAIVRAAAVGPVRMLVPMLSTPQELFQVRNLLKATLRDLKRDGFAVPDHVPLGGMIEVPAAAIAATTFAKYLDFLSIGTNDLIQYTLAIDRIDDQVSHLYDPVHPAILKLIQGVFDAGLRSGTEVTMCGEMAGDPQYTRLLLGLGLRSFSMHPGHLLEVKQAVTETDIDALKDHTRRLMRASNPLRIGAILREMNEL